MHLVRDKLETVWDTGASTKDRADDRLHLDRGIQCTVNPSLSHTHAEVYAFSKGLSEHLLPRTSAYHEIWLDKKQIAGGEVADMEPMYGPTVSANLDTAWRELTKLILSFVVLVHA